MVKVLVDTKGKLLGAHIVGSHAGELIAPLVFAMSYPCLSYDDGRYPADFASLLAKKAF